MTGEGRDLVAADVLLVCVEGTTTPVMITGQSLVLYSHSASASLLILNFIEHVHTLEAYFNFQKF